MYKFNPEITDSFLINEGRFGRAYIAVEESK